jgi:hypothetical protein
VIELIGHTYDERRGCWVLTIGEPVTTIEPVTNPDGQALVDASGAPVHREVRAGWQHVQEVVFAGEDERWEDVPREQLPFEQMRVVQQHLSQSG